LYELLLLRGKKLRVLWSRGYEEVASGSITDREKSALEIVFQSNKPHGPMVKKLTMMNNQAHPGLPPIPFKPLIVVDNKPLRPAES
jgi:hypothetical protein